MNRWMKCVSILFLLGFMGSTAARAQEIGAIEGTARTVGFGVSELENALFSSIANAGTRYSDEKHEAAMAAQWLLLNWKAQYRGLLEKPYSTLKGTEQQAYAALRISMNEAVAAVADGTNEEAEAIAARLATAAGEIPNPKNRPRLSNVTPTLLMELKDRGTVELEGVRLMEGNPVVFVDTLAIPPIQQEGGRLRFELPMEDMPLNDGIRFTNFALYTGKKPRIVRYGQEVGTERFGIVLPVLPVTLATVEPVSVTSTSTSRNTRERSRSITCEAEEAGLANGCNVYINASPDWQINTAIAPRISVVESRDPNDAASIGGVATDGFGVNMSAYRSRRPGSPRGKVTARVTWSEYRDVSRTDNQEITPDTQVIRWGEPVTIQLPAGLDSFSLRVRGFDGRVHTYNRNTEDDLAAVTYDSASGRLTIHPKSIGRQ